MEVNQSGQQLPYQSTSTGLTTNSKLIDDACKQVKIVCPYCGEFVEGPLVPMQEWSSAGSGVRHNGESMTSFARRFTGSCQCGHDLDIRIRLIRLDSDSGTRWEAAVWHHRLPILKRGE